MPLYFIAWDDQASMLVDAEDDATAREIAAERSEGAPPVALRALPPRAFACELVVESSDEAEDGPLVLEPLEPTMALLDALEADPALPFALPERPCAAEAEEYVGNEMVVHVCGRPHGHAGEHEAAPGVRW